MSYLTTKLNGVIRSRSLICRIFTRRSLSYTANWNVFTVGSRNLLLDKRHQFNHDFHQIADYSTVEAAKEPKSRFNANRIDKILAKLSSNKVSLQFDKFVTVRQNLFRNYNISIGDGFEILKSCSQLVDRGTDDRIRLVDECWHELVRMIEKPTRDQVILLLRAYRRAGLKSLENYQTFLEQLNCPIDSEIFAELMYITCQNGDTIEHAETLLKDMSAKNVEPNEQIYNALILGHSKHGIDAIDKVLETMKSKNITPSLDTNVELVKAYLSDGMDEKAIEILQRAEGYSSDQLYDIIRFASIRGNGTIVEKAMHLLPQTIRNAKLIVPQLQNICIELVHLNRLRAVDTQLDPYKLIIRHLTVPDNVNSSDYGMFLLKEMIVVNESVANILRFCENLIEDKRNSYAIHNCCMYSMVFNLPIAYDFLEALAAKELLRPHYFWPLIVRTSNQTEIIKVIRFATKLNVIIDTTTLHSYILPRVNTLIDSQETVKALTEAGIRMLELKTAMITFLLDNGRPKEALDIASRSTSSVDPTVIVPALNKFIRSSVYKRNSYTIASLVKKLQPRCSDKSYDIAGQTVLTVCNNRDKQDDFLLTKRLIHDYEKIEVKLSSKCADLIMDKVLKNRNVHAELNPIVQGLIYEHEHQPEIRSEEPKTTKSGMDIEALEQQLSEFQSNNLPTHGILYRLLLKHVQLEQYDKAIEVKKLCDKNGVLETPAVLSTLIKLWTATNNSNKALEVLETLRRAHPKFKIDVYKVIDLATLLITESRLDGAKQLIDDLPESKDKSKAYLSNNLWRLLDAAAQYGIHNDCKENVCGQFLRMLIEKGYCEHSNTLLGTVIKEFIEKKQIHEAVKAFEQSIEHYQKTPQTLTLLTLLIELSNKPDLSEYSITKDEAIGYIQHMIDMMKEVHGTENTNVNIILAFACAGNEQQLRKILMNPVVKFNVDVLLKSLNYLKDRARIEAVVALARSARGLPHESLQEEQLYELLLSDLVRKNDYEAAIRLYEEIQNDDGCLISKKFSKTLADLLLKNNQPLPEQLRIKVY